MATPDEIRRLLNEGLICGLYAPQMRKGFTLVEMSIVMVVIGLIIGGVLVGQDLIAAATVRAQISQIEKYTTAVKTFRGKYGYLPGDIPDPVATSYGFVARGQYAGEGDGNGIIEGIQANAAGSNWSEAQGGETVVFWRDLSNANLIGNAFTAASSTGALNNHAPAPYFPPAKIGNGNYIYVWGNQYLGLSAVTWVGMACISCVWTPNASVNVIQAYNIDVKMDDGLPQTGRVVAAYIVYSGAMWAGAGTWFSAPYTTATAGSATTCFDNSATATGSPGVAGAAQHYSLEISGGTGINCGISFRFQ